MQERITARFPSSDALESALADLRRSGAVCHTGSLVWPVGAAPTVHFTVRAADACAARAIVRRAGGRLSP